MPEWFGVRTGPGKAFNRPMAQRSTAEFGKKKEDRKEVLAVNLLARKNIKVE
jgi:hypothetical protein